MVIQLTRDLVRLQESLLHILDLGTVDKNDIYKSSSTLFSENKIRPYNLTISKVL